MNMELTMSTVVIATPTKVRDRLAQLGWRKDELLAIVDAMVAARNSCTENDPSSAPGWMAWKEGTRRLREIGQPKGLIRKDDDNIPWTLDPERKLRFAVANTDDATGVSGGTPQNRSRKGPGTERAISHNQMSLFEPEDIPRLLPESTLQVQPGPMISWYLMTFHEGETVRVELSCPAEVSGGYFVDFAERIILIGPGDPYRGSEAEKEEDQEVDFDIPVTRK